MDYSSEGDNDPPSYVEDSDTPFPGGARLESTIMQDTTDTTRPVNENYSPKSNSTNEDDANSIPKSGAEGSKLLVDGDPEQADARSYEKTKGHANTRDISLWTKPAAEFIRSPSGISGVPDMWIGRKPLGEGSFGLAGLWEKVDFEGNVIDELVIKQIGNPFGSSQPWDPNIPHEVTIMEEMNKCRCISVVRIRGYKRYLKEEIHRIYIEYCPYGDLQKLYRRYRRFRQHFPEPFLWEVFYHLINACYSMENGPYDTAWPYEIVHRDIKPENVFLGCEIENGVPFYPVAKLGDFGLSVRTNLDDPKNPNRLIGVGTPIYYAPEQNRRHDPRHHLRKPLAAHTNIWGVAATMFELLTLQNVYAYWYHDGVDPDGSLEGIPEITTNKNPEYSEELRTLIRQCLRPDPYDRPPTSEVQDRVEAARTEFSSVGYDLRGEDKDAPHESERLYYRPNDTESMRPGSWQPANNNSFDHVREADFGDLLAGKGGVQSRLSSSQRQAKTMDLGDPEGTHLEAQGPEGFGQIYDENTMNLDMPPSRPLDHVSASFSKIPNLAYNYFDSDGSQP